jgi:hypothetical protein
MRSSQHEVAVLVDARKHVGDIHHRGSSRPPVMEQAHPFGLLLGPHGP